MSKIKNPDALIRIGDVIEVLCREKCYPGPFCPDSYCTEMWNKFEDVERVDAVPVVRCKYCKHYHSALRYCTLKGTRNWQPDDYCSSGRREGR